MTECVLCKKETDDLNHEIEHLVIDMIKKSNPNWVAEDGACPACINYYENLEDMVKVVE